VQRGRYLHSSTAATPGRYSGSCHFFVAKYAALLRKNIYGFTPRAMQQMCSYAWPGNVRELENFVERMFNLREDGKISDISSLFGRMQAADAAGDGVRANKFRRGARRITGALRNPMPNTGEAMARRLNMRGRVGDA
jgi:DNA-binding NtrC family response regulator